MISTGILPSAATEPAGSEWSDGWDLVVRWLKPNLAQEPVWTGEVAANLRSLDAGGRLLQEIDVTQGY